MPTMLGLTTDPSPHGLNAQSGALTAQGQGKAHGALTGSISGGREKSSSPQRLNNHKNDSKPKKEKGRLQTISARNHAAARDMDTLLWRALCDDPSSAEEYMAKDIQLVAPLIFGTKEAACRNPDHDKGEIDLKEALEDVPEIQGFRMGEVRTIEAALMAMVTIYKLRVKIDGEEIDAMGSSTWRQTAGAEWEMVGGCLARTG
jgi:hypothetical protein